MASSLRETQNACPAAHAILERARCLSSRRKCAQAAVEFRKARGAGTLCRPLSGEALRLYSLSKALSTAQAARAADSTLPEARSIGGRVLGESGRYDDAVLGLDVWYIRDVVESALMSAGATYPKTES